MAKNDSKVTDNPKLKQKKLSDGNYRLYLDYYLGRANVKDDETGDTVSKVQRKREFLKLTLLASPRTPMERKTNKETLLLAQKIRTEKEQEFIEAGNGYRLKKENINFLDFFQNYIDKYTKKDVRMVKIALNRFKDFLHDTHEYSKFASSIKPDQITKDMITDFVEYLGTRSVGGGANSIYQRFKKVVIYAVDHDIMRKNPCKGIACKVDDNALVKDILSEDEMQQLINTHYLNESIEIRRAVTFTLYTGLRWCDTKDLTYKNIDYSNRLLSFDQNKTKQHSRYSHVNTPLTDDLLSIIGTPPDDNREAMIFNLPSYESCDKSLRRWVKRAGINKHISWHCLRHSFATNILSNGANIKTVASLLGHSGLRYTERYTRAVDKLKEDAINSLPKLKL
jgi:integrase/recombinase XerD